MSISIDPGKGATYTLSEIIYYMYKNQQNEFSYESNKKKDWNLQKVKQKMPEF